VRLTCGQILRRRRINFVESFQCLMDREQVHRWLRRCDLLGFDRPALPIPPSALRQVSPGLIDEDAPHGLSRRGKEVAATVPVLGFLGLDQPEVGFMNESGGLESLAGGFLGHLLGG
jgi:hypothetical protein